ncbi:putative cell division protein FtsI [Waddlia chondrophila 2032/99]|uniref:Putative cell division protein FtsI n=2 Tax=Waddlia chondrophila TaxID=71667 RepID=D6YUB5_WADCW|nr:penicillin-binding protein 2 [Waddlia chondrophila]ADI37726.1 putative cell division protein FtsI [Waddlia chondrophila WSU 86-1044]CCB90930.1 putative cell division protein FtsI [Waddlia chondrophila 2032/99]
MRDKGRRRLVAISLGVYFLFSLLIFQFFKLQIAEHEKWSETARKQHFFVVKEPFRRGTFWSNTAIKKKHPEEPQKLVFDIQKHHLYIDPMSISEEHRDVIADEIARTLSLSADERKNIRDAFDRRSRSRKLAMWLDQEEKDQLLNWWSPFARRRKIPSNALYFVADYKRSYPFGKLLGQVLHTVQNQRDETTKQVVPTGGLELAFNKELRGKEGSRLLKRSPKHRFETGQVMHPSVNGQDIHLTINHILQAIAEEEVEKGVKRCGAKKGWAAMMDPGTGAILALAQYPFFYPERYPEYFNDPEKVGDTKVNAITDAYEPGSTMKPITVAISLQANDELRKRGEPPLFDPEEMMPTLDGRFPGRQKVISDTRAHSYLNLNMALQKSSNIYPARLVERIIKRLGNEWYRSALTDTFGFGKPTGIELPSESWGVVPRPGKLHPNGALEWSASTPFSLAMGYNLQATSLQILRAWAVIANGGYWITPHLVAGGGNLPSFRVLDQAVIDRTVEAMKYVTKTGGSGRRADIWGFTEVGKTGTAEKIVNGRYSKKQTVASFVGFAPVKDPVFVLIVVMDEPECRFIPGVGSNLNGSIAAAPVFKEIGRRTLEYLGIPPDDPGGYPYGDPRSDPENADWVKETRQLQEIYEKWNK